MSGAKDEGRQTAAWSFATSLERTSKWRYGGKSISRTLFREMERHAGDDDVGPEEQCAFDEQRSLIVKQMLPPALRHELRQDDGDVVVGLLGGLFDVLEQWLHQRSEWRRQDDQPDAATPRVPVSSQLFGLGRVHVHVDRPDIVG